jgi:hypothetical protein
LAEILPIISDLVKQYGNITAPPTTPPPPPPPSQPSIQSTYWGYTSPYPYYPPFYGYSYGAWQSPPFGPSPIYVMPPVWPWGGAPWYTVGAPQPTAPITPSQPQTTATTMYIVPANMPSNRRREQIRVVVGDDGREQVWKYIPELAQDVLRRQSSGVIRPSVSDLAAAIQGYPQNAAAYEQYRKYYDEIWKERFHNYDLRKALEIAKNPPQWHMELWEKYGGEPEWHKESRQRAVEMLPALIEKYQPEPLQRPQPVSQAPQTQPSATQALPPASQTQVPPIQRPIWQWERDYGYGGRED